MNTTSDRFTGLSPEKQALLLKLSQQKRAAQMPMIATQPRDGRSFTLSYNQQMLWFLSQFSDDAAVAYNLPWAMDLYGALNISALHQSLQWLVARHELFRTRFDLIDNEPRQLILDAVECPWQVHDWRDFETSEREERWQKGVKTAVSTPFDLTKAPPFTVQLFQFSDDHYRLLFVVHHIAFDGWSSGTFFAELGECYSALTAAQTPDLDPLPIQYADYAHWQKSQDELYREQLDYWQSQLAGKLPPLNLPTDFPRPAIQTYRGKSVHTTIPRPLSQALHQLSREENATLYMTLLAAFNVLLYRYTGQTDLLVGTPVANRNQVELEPLIGFFVNTVILRTDLSNTPTFRQLLQRVRRVAEDAFSHQDVPLEKLIERLQPERLLSHNPLFQVMFALHNVPQQTSRFAGLNAIQREVVPDVAQFELSLYLSEDVDGLRATLYFNEDLFTQESAAQLLRHYEALLHAVVQQPDQSIARLPLMTAKEQQKLLEMGCDTAVPYPNHHCVHYLIEEQATRTPDSAAITFESDTISYHDLNQRANQLARHLQYFGIVPDTCIGIYMTRSIDMVIAVLAVLKAGGAYLPLDPTYPQQRIAFMIEDAAVPVILTQSSLADQLPTHSAHMVRVDGDWPLVKRHCTENPITTVTAAHLSYLIYTSGSTGKPKGVMVEHRNVVNFFAGMDAVIPQNNKNSWLSVTSLSFDISVLELLWTLARGFHIVLMADKSHTKTV
ncbi:MAG: AMP-binding protein, partial [Chloroflexi bacterium]|nr:AMP-binding protein [Chloroflexota bacterium]